MQAPQRSRLAVRARRFIILGWIVLAWVVILKIRQGGPLYRNTYGVPPDASIHGSFDLRRKEFETLLREVRKDDAREDLAPYMLAAHVKQIEHEQGSEALRFTLVSWGNASFDYEKGVAWLPTPPPNLRASLDGVPGGIETPIYARLDHDWYLYYSRTDLPLPARR